MPYVLVHFDPARVSQKVIDTVKKGLPYIVAKAMQEHRDDDTVVAHSSIYVRQVATHPTDQNVSPIEIEIRAGMVSGMTERGVALSVQKALAARKLIPDKILETGECCIWVGFFDRSAFVRLGVS